MSATDGLKVTAPILFIDSDIVFLILLFIALESIIIPNYY